MYINSITLKNIKTFKELKIELIHPEKNYNLKNIKGNLILPRPRLPNVNLLLGDNGSGKTTLLKTIALASFGPAISDLRPSESNLVRKIGINTKSTASENLAEIKSSFILHEQDDSQGGIINSNVEIIKRGEIESYKFFSDSEKRLENGSQIRDESLWDRIYESQNDAFFIVGYGATRRVERPENFDMGARIKSKLPRVQRVQGLFEDSYSLIPLSYWLPKLKYDNPGRYTQVVHLINRFLGKGHYEFNGELNSNGEYLFEKKGAKIPFHSLSDGYRAFIGWIADLLYHVCFGCPSGKKLVENKGIVMVDEIDLHLHPKWQMNVIKNIAKTLPLMQFIITSHSPLVTGSLEWMNIIALKISANLVTKSQRIRQSIYGLDADQILLTDFFALKSTRAKPKINLLEELTKKARCGDNEAAKNFLIELSRGMEKTK